MIKPAQPFSFSPDISEMSRLFFKWLPLYVGQAKMDDDEAEPFQAPLQDIERAIDNTNFTSMQDLFHLIVAGSCLGSMSCEIEPEHLDTVYATARAEIEERAKLLSMFEHHQALLKEIEALDDADDGDQGDEWEENRVKKGQEESDFLMQIAALPARSIDNIILKGRYLAALHASHALGYEFANAFIETFAKLGEAAR